MYFAIFFLLIYTAACQITIDAEKESEFLMQTDKDFVHFSAEKVAAKAFYLFLVNDALQLPARRNPIQGRNNIYDSRKENQDNYNLTWSPHLQKYKTQES